MSINRLIDKEEAVHIYNGILLSHKKNHEILPFAPTCMDLENIMLSEISHTRERQILCDITYMWNLNIIQMNIYAKWKQTHRYRKQTSGYQR